MRRIGLFAGIFFFCTTPLFAETYPALGPLVSRTMNPVYLQSLGLTPVRAIALQPGSFELRVDSSFANILLFDAKPGTREDFQLEISRTVFNVKYSFFQDFDVEVEVPFYRFDGGFLDSVIQGYHKFFGFPNGGREFFPNNRYSYQLIDRGVTRFNYPSEAWTLGDIAFHLKQHFSDEGVRAPAAAWFFDFKIPTGDQQKGVANGSPDFGFGLALEKSFGRFHTYFNAASYVLGGNDLLASYMNDAVFSYMAAGDFSIFPSWAVVVEFMGGTPLLRGLGLDSWDGPPLDLLIGCRGEQKGLIAGNDLIWQIGLEEDALDQGPSIHPTFFASLGIRFQKGMSSGVSPDSYPDMALAAGAGTP